MMEPVLILKRAATVAFSLCIICQTSGNEESRPATEYGLERLRDAATKRRQLRDTKHIEMIDRVENAVDFNQIVWHRNCYAQFTDSGKIRRLQATMLKQSQSAGMSTQSSESINQETNTTCTLRRSAGTVVNWAECLFCQIAKPKQKTRSVATFNLSNHILENANLDQGLRTRLAGIADLIAAGGRYHLPCLAAFSRSVDKTQKENKHVDIALCLLCNELRYAAGKGHVIEMSEVWSRYCILAEESGIELPASYRSRRASFKEKLQVCVGDIVEFIPSLRHAPGESRMLVIPVKFTHIPITELAESEAQDDMLTMPTYKTEPDLMSLIHVAFKIRGDISNHHGHVGLSISEDDAIACIPDSLYMFLRLLFGGQKLLDRDGDDVPLPDDETNVQRKILSIAQDIVFNVSGGQKLTPKHVGLGCALHQQTRSKQLVKLFSNAGHIINYDQILQIDTALAENTLSTMNMKNGVVIPPNLLPGRFVHFTADNIDISDETLDGKNTFHATQVAAWQRGPSTISVLKHLKPSKRRQLDVPSVMNTLIPITMIEGKAGPSYENLDSVWFSKPQCEPVYAKVARAIDLAFILKRQNVDIKPGWTFFNESLSLNDDEMTSVGYLPIIQAQAHELDTLNTVVQRCMSISSCLDQQYTVITVDQALYCKLIELKWHVPEYRENVIPRLGGLHIAMNFLNAIGDHLKGCGLVEAWVEAGLLGPLSAEKAMAGKSYNKAMRAHKLTYQALWRILLPQFLEYTKEHDLEIHSRIIFIANSEMSGAEEYVKLVQTDSFEKTMSIFIKENLYCNANLQYWWNYLEIVTILLMFTRAQREGQWDLHLHSFTRMVPFFMRYDHYNYSRWGPIYITEMHQLPPQLIYLFKQGDIVVKRSTRKFNQVDPDQAQEWLNGTGKRGGGIIGITRTPTALARWSLSYNLRSQISADTRIMFGIRDDSLVHNEATTSRQTEDNKVEDSLLSILKRFHVFSAKDDIQEILQSIATKDLATDEIQESLLKAEQLGQEQLDTFVSQRLLKDATVNECSVKKSFHDPIKKNKAPTFNNLYDVRKDAKVKDKQFAMKVDRSILQRLIAAYAAGREVDLTTVLQHELMPVPISLAETNGDLRTGSKVILADCLTTGINCPSAITIRSTSCLLIDGQALVCAMGKPAECKTFGDLAASFVTRIKNASASYNRVDIVFDRYRSDSIKASTRKRRAKATRPIRRIIESCDVPLPVNWANFTALSDNKAELALFLSTEVIKHAPVQQTVIVSGGFADQCEVRTNNQSLSLDMLEATHEEADTRLILHAIHSNHTTVVVKARDTDVLLLLIAHVDKMRCHNLWMEAGTAKKTKFIPVKQVHDTLQPGWVQNLLSFHALTRCDTTSFIAGHSKKTLWNVFKEHHELLCDIGDGVLTQDAIALAEKFMCKAYNVPDIVETTNQARCLLFSTTKKPESLPPTSDALKYHIMRAHYQSLVWKHANCPKPNLPIPTNSGWTLDNGGWIIPILTKLNAIPNGCMEMLTCQCKTGCNTMRCKCRKAKVLCTQTCKCMTMTKERQFACMNKTISS